MNFAPPIIIMPTIILPTKNEAQSIGHTIATIRAVCNNAIVVVDGWSTDGTQYIARYENDVPVITDDVKGKGKGAGLRKAFDWVSDNGHQYDSDVVFVDPDMTYPLLVIPEFIEALREYDLVIGERFDLRVLPFPLRVGDWLSRRLFRIIYGQKLDNMSGFRGLSRSAIEKMDLQEDGFGIETEITAKAVRLGLRIKSIPIHYCPRKGNAKFRPIRDGLVVIRALLRYRNWHRNI
jgi:dolichol-phosphate mannosyltransferase